MSQDNGDGRGPWRFENPGTGFPVIEKMLELSRVGATRPWSIPEKWVDWIGRCVRHGCLDAPESYPYRGARPLLLCAAFPFDQYRVPCKRTIHIEGPRCAPGQPLLDPEGFPLTLGGLLLWAHVHRCDTAHMTFPYPDVTFGSERDTQAVTAYARWLDASVKLGFLSLSGGLRGMVTARGDEDERRRATLARHRDRIRALPAVPDLARAATTMQTIVFEDLIGFARKDRTWYRVLKLWTQSRIVTDEPIPRLVEDFWRQRPAEPKGGGGRLANRATDAVRSVRLVHALTATGLRVKEQVRSDDGSLVGATELAGALLGLSPDKVRDYWKRYKRQKFPLYLAVGVGLGEGRVAAGSRPPGACADPRIPADAGARLLELWSRRSTERGEHDPRSAQRTGDE